MHFLYNVLLSSYKMKELIKKRPNLATISVFFVKYFLDCLMAAIHAIVLLFFEFIVTQNLNYSSANPSIDSILWETAAFFIYSE